MSELMRRQGYAATGMQQIATAAEAPTGSIYHHFKGGKRDIAAEALVQSGAAYLELLFMIVAQIDDPVAGVRHAFSEAAEVLAQTEWVNLCPVATVLGEVADTEPEIREAGSAVFVSWVEAGTDYYTARGLTRAEARQFAYALIAGLEGAFVLARTLRSKAPLLAAGETLARALEVLLNRASV